MPVGGACSHQAYALRWERVSEQGDVRRSGRLMRKTMVMRGGRGGPQEGGAVWEGPLLGGGTWLTPRWCDAALPSSHVCLRYTKFKESNT